MIHATAWEETNGTARACLLCWRQRKKPTPAAEEKSDRKRTWRGSQKPDTHGLIGGSNFEFNSKKPLRGFEQKEM